MDPGLLRCSARVPEHVVYRTFPSETVALNLDSGSYHGLNATAGRMLEVTTASSTIGDAVERLVKEFQVDRETITRDLGELCTTLRERGLVEISSPEV